MFELTGVADEAWAIKVLKAARRARSLDEIIAHVRAKAWKYPPKGTGWFLTVVKERFGLVGEDGAPVDRKSVERAAIEKFGGRGKIPYGFTQLLWESPELAAERLAQWGDESAA
jgi:hypothetical protein